MTIEPVHDASVARDDVAEILDFECPFESAGKEAAEGSDDRGENTHEKDVDEEGFQRHRFPKLQHFGQRAQRLNWQLVFLRSENGRRLASVMSHMTHSFVQLCKYVNQYCIGSVYFLKYQ